MLLYKIIMDACVSVLVRLLCAVHHTVDDRVDYRRAIIRTHGTKVVVLHFYPKHTHTHTEWQWYSHPTNPATCIYTYVGMCNTLSLYYRNLWVASCSCGFLTVYILCGVCKPIFENAKHTHTHTHRLANTRTYVHVGYEKRTASFPWHLISFSNRVFFFLSLHEQEHENMINHNIDMVVVEVFKQFLIHTSTGTFYNKQNNERATSEAS